VKLLAAFWGPIPWMIEVAAILSLVVRHWPDFGIILALLVVNALVGFWEEYQADTTIAALKSKLALQARVKRDGNWATIPARELVPGDLIHLRLGEIAPADARLLPGDPVEVDQSALTGESLPVTRKANENVYSGSIVKRGEIDALVYATGQETYFGATARLVETAHTTSHFQHVVLKIGDYLILIALTLVILILLVALFRGDNMLTTLQFALILTVTAIPVAMPTVLSVTMAVRPATILLGAVIGTQVLATPKFHSPREGMKRPGLLTQRLRHESIDALYCSPQGSGPGDRGTHESRAWLTAANTRSFTRNEFWSVGGSLTH
jgi:H+-transporting ATPase